ncbi:MAG TPA: dihydrofolate reductase family protein [Candidatus Saccharimonadales bacterium]|nr:dihydrofolate reductase family protein [Candidatus Saccharimonadales bacterium]
MGKLIYLMTTTLDGFAADDAGKFDWARPTEEVHAFVNDQLRNVATILMGSKLYETMKVWEDIPTEGVGGFMDGPSQALNDYAKIWHGANKIVYSTSLTDVAIANTTIERKFDVGAVRKLVAESARDVDIGGPHLAAEAIKANIVDEYHHIIAPVLIGSGLRWLPEGAHSQLQLVSTRTFENGFVHLHYRKKI